MSEDCDDLQVTTLDVLDLDETLVDDKIKNLMSRNDYSVKYLNVLLGLLKYKYLINLKENTECNNENECAFIPKLLITLSKDNIDIICKIMTITLLLQPSNLSCNAEHFLQQILVDITETLQQNKDSSLQDVLFKLKLVNSILKAAELANIKINLIFLDLCLAKIIYNDNEEVRNYFIYKSIPAFVENVDSYFILDEIWNIVLLQYTKKDVSLFLLSALSEYYIPVSNPNCKVKYQCNLIEKEVFWKIIIYGLQSDDQFTRRCSIYLAKRSIDSCMLNKNTLNIKTKENITLISWNNRDVLKFKEMWVNYFTLLESLEEKQSNIVIPSLQLFDVVSDIGRKWLNPALKLGLCHENLLVRQKCLTHRLKYNIESTEEEIILLNSLNNNYILEEREIKDKLKVFFSNELNFKYLILKFSAVNWSLIPVYNIIDIITETNISNVYKLISEADLTEQICLFLQNSCNNIVIREWVHYKIISFVCKTYQYLQWMNFLKIINKIYTCEGNKTILSPIEEWLKSLDLFDDERLKLLNYFINSYIYIDITVIYLNIFKNDLDYFNKCLINKMTNINDIISRQYADKMECFEDFVYIVFYFQASKSHNEFQEYFSSIILYIQSLLTNKVCLSRNQLDLFSKCCLYLYSIAKNHDIVLQTYKFSVTTLKDGTFAHKLLALTVLKNLTTNKFQDLTYRHEMIKIKEVLDISTNATFNMTDDQENLGRNLSKFYEDSCDILYELINSTIEHNDLIVDSQLKLLVNYMEHIVDCGGYGCLKWVLKIMNIILPQILNNKNIEFDTIKFIDRSWKEIEELKSSNQFLKCIQEFICVITNKALVNDANFNNILLCYSTKIIDFASLSNAPLYFLTQRLLSIDLKSSSLIYIFSEILLFCPVLRKDQRTLDKIVKSILSNDNHTFGAYHFNYEINNLAVSKLLIIEDQELYDLVLSRIMSKISELFKNKQRYHENSQTHRTLSTALQHLLFTFTIRSQTMDIEKVAMWCVEIFAKIPHQNDVKFYFEWIITLYLLKINTLNTKNLDKINFEKIPAISKLMIMYFYMQNLGLNGHHSFVLDYLLSHTMGQIFNVRLTAQYLSLKLFNKFKNHIDLSKYNYVMLLIENNFNENSKEKNYLKLQNSYLVNNFDAVLFLKPDFVYYYLPQYFNGVNQEVFDFNFFPTKSQIKVYSDKHGIAGDETFYSNESLRDDFEFNVKITSSFEEHANNIINLEDIGNANLTIQKKYIPWNYMKDIQTFDLNGMKENRSQLILVASLIDKLPNLGGMARTSEVFGVHTYVVDSLRHLEDRQFQGLSVSAERWVNIEEVRPGKPLKDYLMKKKEQGYSIVGAEQTSTSINLQTFRFPVKSILLLGHEKEGIPCGLLPVMDYCVEIPQQGVVRSLNVHVTAAIFVWEYVRQNVL